MTYAGHPLACATGVESIRVYLEDDVVGHAAEMGELLGALLGELAARHPSIGDVRGRGLFYGIELVRDRESRAPLVPFNARGTDAAPMKELIGAAMDAGLYLSSFSNVVRLTPPLIIPPDELRLGVELLDGVLDLADRHYEGAA
jgi:taurine--2-oxoglutarate transaminase